MHKKSDQTTIGGHHYEIDTHKVTLFRSSLLKWYHVEGRSLPWRETKNPYKIWVSEIILQQTQVQQGLNYYLRFIEALPDIKSLSEVSDQDLMVLWQGLGYYSRAHNLRYAAKQIMSDHNGIFPSDPKEVSGLKGIGPYTMAAIMSIAFDQPIAAVDGNVYRVMSRINALDIPIDQTLGKKLFAHVAQQYISPTHPGDYHQAIMDLGATICTFRSPKCDLCPVQQVCQVVDLPELRDQLPIKSKKVNIKKICMDFICIIHDDQVLIEQRDQKGIWKGLYQFPLISENATHPTTSKIQTLSSQLLKFNGLEYQGKVHLEHKLTHRHLDIFIHLIHVNDSHVQLGRGLMVRIDSLGNYAFPKPLRAFIDHSLCAHGRLPGLI